MYNEISQTQKTADGKIPFRKNFWKRKVYGDRKCISSCLKLRAGLTTNRPKGDRNVLKLEWRNDCRTV